MRDFVEVHQPVNDELACTSCGAILKFKPGTHHLVCEYCGSENEIAVPKGAEEIREQSLEEFLIKNFDNEDTTEVKWVKCQKCGASSSFDERVSSDQCPFCASPVVIETGTTSRLHKPQCLLPFAINEQQALFNFRKWLKSQWFAPGDLKHYADTADKLNGIYLPFWTFDCTTDTEYTGQRGEDYQVTETYSELENGRHVTKTRTVTRTRWYHASGKVHNTFDDLLIEATESVPRVLLRSLEPWDLKKVVPYTDGYLSGFRTLIYSVDLKRAYEGAKARMQSDIRAKIMVDIGGDRQLIHYSTSTYHHPTFKHILLPVWISAFRYNNKVYQFVVNAQTGEVQGRRPYSIFKIVIAVIIGLIIFLFFAAISG